ncbi:MAG: hypothetical protein LBB81_08665 [Treponema sp.]|jgi:tetratricopeptide (TPR) repeat protein|nr:hypothetical protein [Treponema sp.]
MIGFFKQGLFHVLILLVFSFPVFAQNTPWWLSLEQGKLKFRNRDYGGALMSFEDARRQRKAVYEQMERDFINLLSINEVRRLGDTLDRIDNYSRDRHYIAATAALEELYYRMPKDSFRNSAGAALKAFNFLKDYPEAEYWIGEVYRVEGELQLALNQYRKAYDLRELLENEDFAVELLYKTAGVSGVMRNYQEMIRVYNSIITGNDSLWTDAEKGDLSRLAQTAEDDPGKRPAIPYAQASASFAVNAMTNTLATNGIDRFLELYRYNNHVVEKAHRELGFYHELYGQPSAVQHLMFAFLIQNTLILEEITRRQYDFKLTEDSLKQRMDNFTYVYLVKIAEEINKSDYLSSYAGEVEYYKTIYYLGTSLYRNGRTAIARNFWEFLSVIPQAGEWRGRAIRQLGSPSLFNINNP